MALDVQSTIDAVTAGDLLANQRQDHMLARQAIANHQTMAHYQDYIFNRDAVTVSFREATAITDAHQGQLAGMIAGLNTGNSTPSSPGSTAQQTGKQIA